MWESAAVLGARAPQVQLLKHMRRSTARDFRIQLEELTRAVRRVEEEREDQEQSQEIRKVRAPWLCVVRQ